LKKNKLTTLFDVTLNIDIFYDYVPGAKTQVFTGRAKKRGKFSLSLSLSL